MIDWSELENALESPEDAPTSPQSDGVAKAVGEAVPRGTSAIEHWRRNLERFPPGHIGHEYAREALEKLMPSLEVVEGLDEWAAN